MVYSGGQYADTTITEDLDIGSGFYVIPKGFFEDATSIAHRLEVRLSHRESGLTNPKLIINSRIIHDFTLEGNIDVVD